jgi:hypothetical protein
MSPLRRRTTARSDNCVESRVQPRGKTRFGSSGKRLAARGLLADNLRSRWPGSNARHTRRPTCSTHAVEIEWLPKPVVLHVAGSATPVAANRRSSAASSDCPSASSTVLTSRSARCSKKPVANPHHGREEAACESVQHRRLSRKSPGLMRTPTLARSVAADRRRAGPGPAAVRSRPRNRQSSNDEAAPKSAWGVLAQRRRRDHVAQHRPGPRASFDTRPRCRLTACGGPDAGRGPALRRLNATPIDASPEPRTLTPRARGRAGARPCRRRRSWSARAPGRSRSASTPCGSCRGRRSPTSGAARR